MKSERERFSEKEWPRLKQSYKYKLEQAVKDGWIPACALGSDRLETLEQVTVTVDDGMLLHETGSEGFMTAFDATSTAEVFLPGYTYLETTYHELTHVMVGARKTIRKSAGRLESGLMNHGMLRIFTEKDINAGRVLNEAVTEHIAQTMGRIIDPDPDLIDPNAQFSLSGSYYPERELLDVLCNGGVKPIDIRLFTKAYFEDSTSLRQPAIRKLQRELKKAFPGRDVLSELCEFIPEGEYIEARENLPQFTLDLRLARVN